MDEVTGISFTLASYLLGGVPQVYLLGRLRGRDLRQEADLHLALWGMSRPLGALGILGDIVKGPIPVLAAQLLGLEAWVQAGAGLGVVAGQMWPPFLPGTGGKGNSTALPMALALAPLPLLLALLPILMGLGVRTIARQAQGHSWLSGPPSRSLPVGMLVGFASLPFWSWQQGERWEITLAFLVLFILTVVRRLTAGLRADLRDAPNKASVLFHRFLYDRSFP